MNLDKIHTSVLESVKQSFEKHYLEALGNYNMMEWRHNRYYNEYVDNLIKAYLPIFDACYKNWAPKKDPSRRE